MARRPRVTRRLATSGHPSFDASTYPHSIVNRGSLTAPHGCETRKELGGGGVKPASVGPDLTVIGRLQISTSAKFKIDLES